MPSANEQLVDRAYRHALALAAYDRGLLAQCLQLLDHGARDLVAKLASRLAGIEERGFDQGLQTTRRLSDLLAEARAITETTVSGIEERLAGELVEFAGAEAAFQRDGLIAATASQLGVGLPSPARLRAIVTQSPIDGSLLSDWATDLGRQRVRAVEQQVRLGMMAGENTDQIVRRIRGTRKAGYRDGVLEQSRRGCQTMVRTAVSHVSNAAAQETWRANEHVVRAWQFLATLDARTSTTCAGLSGGVHPLGEGPIPPRHRRCRSTSVPVTRSFRELGLDADELPEGKRASMNGQVAARTTMTDWLKGKGAATQEAILGKTRAELFRRGELSLQDFIDRDGRVLTLDELRREHGLILAK